VSANREKVVVQRVSFCYLWHYWAPIIQLRLPARVLEVGIHGTRHFPCCLRMDKRTPGGRRETYIKQLWECEFNVIRRFHKFHFT
jgi:hypothetical protein